MLGATRHAAIVAFLLLLGAPAARAQDKPAPKPEPQGFSASDVQILYGWKFKEPGISVDVPKSIVTFENTTVGAWGSSYLFIDFIRSWSAPDTNAKELTCGV